jgi:hypothetical protein
LGAKNEIRLHDTFKRLTSKVLTDINIQAIPQGIKTVFSFTGEFSFHLFPHPNNPNLPLWELFMATSPSSNPGEQTPLLVLSL